MADLLVRTPLQQPFVVVQQGTLDEAQHEPLPLHGQEAHAPGMRVERRAAVLPDLAHGG